VCQTGTRLVDDRDKAKYPGLTRAEITFYIDENIPSDTLIDEILQSVISILYSICIHMEILL
jgi:hypothetical protein